MSASLAALREYVTADSGAQRRADSTVLLSVTHSNLHAVFMELRFDTHVRVPPSAPADAGSRSA
jgi:tubulin-folding cofactor B